MPEPIDKEVRKDAEENIVQKILQNRATTLVSFGAILLAAVFFITRPQNAIELRVALLEQKQENDNELVLKIQNLKDNDIHEIHLANERLEKQIQDMSKEMAAMNAKIDLLIAK